MNRQRIALLAIMAVLIVAPSPKLAQGITDIEAEMQAHKIIVDTDAGVDDAAAIAYLLMQRQEPVNLLGITTVAGNATVENAANNALTILDAAGRSAVPVVVGASQPLSRTLSHTGKLIHGPDGLWSVGAAHPHNISALPHDVPAFYRQQALAHPGATLIALGPLTNVAIAIQRYPQEMRAYGKIVVLGGAKSGGNQTPVSEFNIWQDPEAANVVFRSGIPLVMVPLDTFTTFTVTTEDINRLRTNGSPVARLLADPLTAYAQVQTGAAGQAEINIPDVVAVMAALQPELLETPQSALVEVILGSGLVRGQTIIGLTFSEKLTMLAGEDEFSQLVDRALTEPGFDLNAALGAILARRADNAQLIFGLNNRRMGRQFMRALTR